MSPTPEARIKTLVSSVAELKPLPATVTRALKLMEDPDVSIEEVADLLALDQAFAARILKLANSAYFGIPNPSTTLQEAITRLGLRRTRNVLMAASYSSLLGRRLASYNLGRGELWMHSVAVATTAQRLAQCTAYSAPDVAYTAGLLHDIGKLVLDQNLRIDWDWLLEAGESRQCTLIEVEESWLGMNHAQVGAELGRRWELPPLLVDAIAYHHAPMVANVSPKLASIIHVSDAVCLHLKIGLAHPALIPKLNPDAMSLLDMEEHDVEFLTNFFADLLGSWLNVEASMIAESGM